MRDMNPNPSAQQQQTCPLGKHQVVHTMQDLDGDRTRTKRPVKRQSNHHEQHHTQHQTRVAKAVRAIITRARMEAATVAQKLAVITNAGVRSMSPISQRRIVTQADLGWAAGFFDGEGCVHIARQTYKKDATRRPTYRLRLHIAQCSLDVLQEFEWIVGVSGRIVSPKPTKKQNRVCHALVYDGMKAFVVLQKLHEHLRRKRPQSALAAEFRDRCQIHVHPGPGGMAEEVWELREWYYKRMMLLNQKC